MGLPGCVALPTLQTQEFTCLVCRADFRAQVCVQHGFTVRRSTDFRNREQGTQSLPFELVTCLRCGFSARPGAYTDPDEMLQVDYSCQSFVWSAIEPQLPRDESALDTSLRYEFAALIAEQQNRDAHVVGDMWLRAAWACMDERDTEAERYYRLKAVAMYEACIAGYGVIARERRGQVVYLIGELWRRIGDWRRAAPWFARVAEEAQGTDDAGWLIPLAVQQATSPKDWI